MRQLCFWAYAVAGVVAMAEPALAVQFPNLDPAYTQEIYTGPLVGGPGMAWTSGGNLLTRNGSQIIEYSPTQNSTYNGTSLHGAIATHNIAGLDPSGAGMVKGLDGYIYAPGPSGLQRFQLSTWGAAQTLAGTAAGPGYGATVLPDGRIAYNADTPFLSASNRIHLYNPGTNTDQLIYTSPGLIDDIESGPGGIIALAGHGNSEIIIINSSGAVLSQFPVAHYPDGLAFGAGAYANSLYCNNNDGTITRFTWSSGFSGAPSNILDIATGSQAYGDLAAVGPDCAFYVSQFDNYGLNGSTWGVGTHWDNSSTTNQASIVRIGLAASPDGSPADCGFYNVYESVPEPTALGVAGMASAGLLFRRRQPAIRLRP